MRSLLSILTALAPLVAGAVVAAVAASVEAVEVPSRAVEALRRATRPPASASAPDAPRVLRAPSLARWSPEPRAPAAPPTDGDGAARLLATALHFDALIYHRPADDPSVRGIVRRGTALPVERPLFGPGCAGGRWYAVAPRGVVCTRKGFHVGPDAQEVLQRAAAPDLPLPYRFAKVITPRAPRFYRVPSAHEAAEADAAIAEGDAPPEVVERVMAGEYYVALDARDPERPDWVRTVRGRYVRAHDVEPLPTPTMVGEALGPGGARLPLAFVHGDDGPLYQLEEGRPPAVRAVGVAEKHARLAVRAERTVGGERYVVDASGHALPRARVRVARALRRPEAIPADAKWVHVDLGEQTLVAYEGDRPVYATLVSSGKPGYDTPRGHFRVRLKYLSATMSGDDPIDGFYEVEEVPWTMYYFEGYALHGAYWHDDFGNVRSHGCTNVAPADARWLYFWTTPRVPDGWHGRRMLEGGTHLWFTR